MSALPPKADKQQTSPKVRLVPKAEKTRCSKKYGYSITSSAVASSVGGRSAYTRPTSGDHCNAFLEKPGHFSVPIAQRIANYQKMIRSASETLHVKIGSSMPIADPCGAAKRRRYSITSSAATSSLSGTVMPSIRAVRGTAVQFEHSKQSARRERAIGCAMQTGRRPIVERVQQ
jgi:hypothetical protein